VKTFQRIIGVPGLSNLGVVAEGKVYRAAQPEYALYPEFLLSHVAYSCNILNLREESEQAEVESMGVKYFQLRLNVLSHMAVEDFDLIAHTLSNPDNQPILVHCQSGVDRTGAACAAYRMVVNRWSLSEAWEEAETYGGGIHDILNLKLKYHLEKYWKELNKRINLKILDRGLMR
jgi:protein tyrosine/serine phosphatase